MKKFLSYFWSIKTDIIPSDYSEQLEVTWENGKKVLNTKNANYSYGSLQKILETGLKQINLKNVNTILLLGLGAGSIIDSLYKKLNYVGKITAVEFDEKVIAIAKNEFHITKYNKLKIVHDDALQFVKKASEKYDLIIVDLFIDTQVPQQFYSHGFCNDLKKTLSKKGVILFNTGIDLDAKTTNTLKNNFKEYQCNIISKVEKTNELLIIKS